MKDYGIGISTYFNQSILNKNRLDIFKKSISSLCNIKEDFPIIIVDDGSTTKEHIQFTNSLQDDRITIIENNLNEGYAKTKNIAIHTILKDCNFGIIADDDIHYKNQYSLKNYIDSMKQTNFHHFCFYDESYWGFDNYFGEELIVNEVKIRRTNLVQGGLITFSNKFIEDNGYIKIFPAKLGHEHTHWTLKAIHNKLIPGFIDLIDSKDYIEYLDKGIATTRPEDFSEMANINAAYMYSGFDIKESHNE